MKTTIDILDILYPIVNVASVKIAQNFDAEGKRIFYIQPTAPYDIGDFWGESSIVKVCITACSGNDYECDNFITSDGKQFITSDFEDFRVNLQYILFRASDWELADIKNKIYRNKKPLNSELRDIVILPLSNYPGDEIINDAVVMINCFCKNFDNGTPDITKLRAIINAVVAVIEDYNNISNYYTFIITNQILLQDTDQATMSYVNLRINCLIEK